MFQPGIDLVGSTSIGNCRKSGVISLKGRRWSRIVFETVILRSYASGNITDSTSHSLFPHALAEDVAVASCTTSRGLGVTDPYLSSANGR